MKRLDKNYFRSGNIYVNEPESIHYKGLSLTEIFKVVAYLNSVAYDYDINNPPRMDKSIHSFRRLK